MTRWAIQFHSGMLGVEPNYLLYSKVSAGCIPQEDCTPLHAGGAAATCPPPRGFWGGGAIPLGWGVRGQRPRKKKIGPTYFRQFRADILSPGRHISETTYFWDHMILGGFRHIVFADGFLFPVKELGFWTNPGHWVRVLDAAGSYMYIVL